MDWTAIKAEDQTLVHQVAQIGLFHLPAASVHLQLRT